MRDEEAREKTKPSIVCGFRGKEEKRPYDRERSGTNKCEERHHDQILSTYILSDGSVDHDQRRPNSSTLGAFIGPH